jgi:para-aminobenzoate synthetase component 1
MGSLGQTVLPRLRTEAFDADTAVEWALVSFCSQPDGFALESAAPDPGYGRYTILGCDAVDTVSVATAGAADPIGPLIAGMGRGFAATPGPPVPFAGGWVGFLSYEAGLAWDRIVDGGKPGRVLPDARFSLYDAVAVFEHATKQWYAAGVDWPDAVRGARPALADRLGRVMERVRSSREPPPVSGAGPICPPPQPNMRRRTYLDKVARAKRYIEAGDIYQVNLTQRFSTPLRASPLEVYRRLRQANPAPLAAYLAWDDRAVLCSSPELFLDLRGRRVVTRPIKGTRPRIGDALVDAARREELARSEKDRAELNMIIDLLRNDIGRVCRFGSVRVLSAGDIEEHPTVFHRVATVVGELEEGRTWADLLRATFPGGSVTGAPKIRAMQIIDELEPTPRDVYCGAIGYVGLDGTMALNIAIRTMITRGDRLHLYAGGAIVADSDPEDEYEETLAKAAGMMRALGHEVFAETVIEK